MKSQIHRTVIALGACALLALPATVAAQSTFIVEFNRTGVPGTTEVVDIVTGETVVVDTGAINNFCTQEYVDLFGSSLIKTTLTVAKNGTRTISVDVDTRATGTGWIPFPNEPVLDPLTGKPAWDLWVLDPLNVMQPTGSAYTATGNQSFVVKENTTTTTFIADFTDKLVIKGEGPVDNMVVKAVFRIKILKGVIQQPEMVRMTLECRG